jgi:hypothetical protein
MAAETSERERERAVEGGVLSAIGSILKSLSLPPFGFDFFLLFFTFYFLK